LKATIRVGKSMSTASPGEWFEGVTGMSDVATRARAAASELASLSEDQLYAELGTRLQSIARTPDGSDRFDMVPGQPLESYGPREELKKLGQKFFVRWNREAYNLICGSSSEEAAAREQVLSAFGIGRDAVIAAIAAGLTVYLGLAAALAAVVAALAVRLFFKPGYEATCDYWKENLPS
jgi:hypothetical protein